MKTCLVPPKKKKKKRTITEIKNSPFVALMKKVSVVMTGCPAYFRGPKLWEELRNSTRVLFFIKLIDILSLSVCVFHRWRKPWRVWRMPPMNRTWLTASRSLEKRWWSWTMWLHADSRCVLHTHRNTQTHVQYTHMGPSWWGGGGCLGLSVLATSTLAASTAWCLSALHWED